MTRPGEDEWFGQIKRYGIEYHTSRSRKAETERECLVKEQKRIALLKRKLVEQLEIPDKIFLRRDWPRSISEMEDLFSALQVYGPHKLLWVDHTDRSEEIGELDVIQPGLLRAKYGHFWPDAAPSPGGLGIWLRLLNKALRACDTSAWIRLNQAATGMSNASSDDVVNSGWFSARGALAAPAGDIPPITPSIPVIRHTMQEGISINDGSIFCCEGAKLKADSIYNLSAWVWIPALFSGWVGLTFPEVAWIRMWPVDLDRRECWQRIVTSARLPDGFCGQPGLVVQTEAGESFFSTGWRLEAGLIPADCLNVS